MEGKQTSRRYMYATSSPAPLPLQDYFFHKEGVANGGNRYLTASRCHSPACVYASQCCYATRLLVSLHHTDAARLLAPVHRTAAGRMRAIPGCHPFWTRAGVLAFLCGTSPTPTRLLFMPAGADLPQRRGGGRRDNIPQHPSGKFGSQACSPCSAGRLPAVINLPVRLFPRFVRCSRAVTTGLSSPIAPARCAASLATAARHVHWLSAQLRLQEHKQDSTLCLQVLAVKPRKGDAVLFHSIKPTGACCPG